MQSSPTVFIVQEPTPDRETGGPSRDFTPALRFGQRRVVLAHDVREEHGDDLAQRLWDAGLKDYRDGDSLLLAGHPATIGIATALVAMFHPVRLLIWSPKTRSYSLIEFDMDDITSKLDEEEIEDGVKD